jgi:hypothetical protein
MVTAAARNPWSSKEVMELLLARDANVEVEMTAVSRRHGAAASRRCPISRSLRRR